jgi:hypothetical protein
LARVFGVRTDFIDIVWQNDASVATRAASISLTAVSRHASRFIFGLNLDFCATNA